jgi:hypothetical protein
VQQEDNRVTTEVIMPLIAEYISRERIACIIKDFLGHKLTIAAAKFIDPLADRIFEKLLVKQSDYHYCQECPAAGWCLAVPNDPRCKEIKKHKEG